MNKIHVKDFILAQLKQALANAKLAANNAHLAAIDEQSIAETQYDTLAIEAGYLAQGQANRIAQLKADIKTMLQTSIEPKSRVQVGALVELCHDDHQLHYYFISFVAGGTRCDMGGHTITVITPQSPIALRLLDKEVGDEVELNFAEKQRIAEISAIY